MRAGLLRRAIAAGKHIYCEKPVADNLADALDVARLAKQAGVKNGVVQDKLFLPGLLKLKLAIDSGFLGRLLSVRGEFGYWVFEGDLQPTQRPSWNYKKAEGGGVILDMLCHWRYVLDNLFGETKSVVCRGATHIPTRWDEQGQPYQADADDAAYAIFELEGGVIAQINSSWTTRVRRDDLVTFHVDGTHGSAVAGLMQCRTQSRVNTPRPVWSPDTPQPINFFDGWQEMPDAGALSERLPRRVGAVPAPCRRRDRGLPLGPARRRQGRAARRGRPAILGRAPLDRPAETRDLTGDRPALAQHRHRPRQMGPRRVHRGLRQARHPRHRALA